MPSFSSVRNTLIRIDADSNSIESLGDEAFRDLEALRIVYVRNNSIAYISDNAFNGTSLQVLYMSNNRLRVLPSFSAVKNTFLDIEATYNVIETISEETFRDVRRLRYVNLQHNQISSISANAFDGSGLGQLYMSYNHLKEWPHLHGVENTLYQVNVDNNAIQSFGSSFFSNTSNLHYLIISQNNISELPSFQSTRSLYHIRADSNALETIGDDVFRDLNRLRYVYLQDNDISFISDSAFNGTIITSINISNNLLQALPLFYSINNSVRYIYASNNAIMTIRKYEFKEFRRLRHIELDGNLISFISGDAFIGTSLEHLNVSGNRLASLPPLHSLSSIVTLDVKNNFIETISYHEFLYLTSLSYIDLSSNRLTSFPEFIRNNIRIVKADDNQIEYIPAFFFVDKFSLSQLSIKNNRLSEFPDFTYLPERNVLTSLSLSHNNITDLAATALHKTPQLGLLELTGNRLTKIPILQNTAVRTLGLQDNAINEIPDYRFEGMGLISLNLSNNRLRYFPNVFPLIASIETLDLSNNHIGPVASGIVLKLLQASNRLEYIDLRNIGLQTIPDIRLIQRKFSNMYMMNPDSMRCDCPMNWMTDFIKKSANITSVTDITPDSTPCASPTALIGKELNTITFDDLCNPATPTTPDAPRETSPPSHQQTSNVGGSVEVSAVGASLGTLLLLAILLIVFLLYRHVLQRPRAVSKTRDEANDNTNEAYESIEIAQISRPESNTYAELQVTNAQNETDPYSIYDNC